MLLSGLGKEAAVPGVRAALQEFRGRSGLSLPPPVAVRRPALPTDAGCCADHRQSTSDLRRAEYRSALSHGPRYTLISTGIVLVHKLLLYHFPRWRFGRYGHISPRPPSSLRQGDRSVEH